MPPPSGPSPAGAASSVVDDEVNNNENWSSFQNFFQGWLIRQQNYLNQLLTAQINIQNRTHEELNNLSSQVLSHYQQYYQAKSIVSHKDVFIMFAPPWFSSLEHTFLWITGFKPCLAFKVLNNSVTDLSRDQLQSIQRLRAETGVSERQLSDEMATIQESLASPPLFDLARKMGMTEQQQQQQQQEEEMRNVEAAIQSLREAMEGLVESADFIRMNTSRKIVEILSPVQSIKFLAAATKLQVRIRSLGLQKDAERRRRRRSGDGVVVGCWNVVRKLRSHKPILYKLHHPFCFSKSHRLITNPSIGVPWSDIVNKVSSPIEDRICLTNPDSGVREPQ